MKNIAFCLFCLALFVAANAFSCRTEPERCEDGQCCVEFGIFGRCRPLLSEGDQCELRPTVSTFDKHVYLMKCPCGDGLECKEDDSGSTIQGKCVKSE
ncbi:venom protein 164-like [Uloborus diversus]|uniref:venom protein 164-like n=1 Tax=Uloborus diversus TaxID=327109 RepID=UPI00240A6BB3|nr:venom protein 164-like [Uloborus diversus]